MVSGNMTIANSKEFFSSIKKHPENFYIVHYSCQSLNDDNEGLSPRITSIGVTHFATEQTVSFSTHAIAEEMGIAREDVRRDFDEVERNSSITSTGSFETGATNTGYTGI